MKKRIHINQHAIKRNQKRGLRDPVVTCKTANENYKADSAHIQGPCHLVYQPEDPLKCGARVWIEVADGVPVHLLDAEGNVTEELI